MTNNDLLWQRAEYDVHTTATLSDSTLEAIAALEAESRIAFDIAMKFAGFHSPVKQPVQPVTALERDRVRAARLMLLTLRLDSSDPAWSSWMIDRMLETVVELPGGSVDDLLHALHEILGEYAVELTKPVANLIKDIVVASYTRYRKSYESLDWKWLIHEVIEGESPAQNYMALLALPPSELFARSAIAILRTLVGTPYWDNAVASLREYVENEEGRSLLRQWLQEGIQASQAKDIKRMLELV